MTNLLPPDALRTVRASHRSRFLFVGALFLLGCALFALVSLVPVYLIVRAEKGPAEEVLQGAARSTQDEDREAIVRAQLLIRDLRPLASSTASLVETIEMVLLAKPGNVTITGLSLVRGNPGTIVIGGIAPSRDTLNAYRAVLAKDPHFESVTLPVASLTGAESGRFTMTLTGSM